MFLGLPKVCFRITVCFEKLQIQGFHVPSISSEVLALGDDVCVVLLSGLLLFFSFFFTLKPAQFGFCTHFQGKYSNIRYDFKRQ